MNQPPQRTSALNDDPRLKPYFSNEEERRQVTQDMFDRAAHGYDNAEALTALGSGPWYRREVLRRNGLATGMRLLDVAAGTGLVTAAAVEMVGPTGHVWALDPSPGMLTELKKKVKVETLLGYAEDIPLAESSVDFVSMGYALRHVGDLDKAFNEFHRVLRADGRVCIMEISRPGNRLLRSLLHVHISVLVPLMARLTGRHADVKRLWAYYGDTIEAALAPEPIMAAMRRAGFTDVDCSVSLGIFREYTARTL